MDKREKFYNLLKTVFISGLSSVRKYEKERKLIFSHHNFPSISNKSFSNIFPSLSTNLGLGGPKDYTSVFRESCKTDFVDFNTLKGANEYKQNIKEDEYIKHFFLGKMPEKSDTFSFLDFYSERFVTCMLDNYIHKYKTNYFKTQKFNIISKKYIDCIFQNKAEINIYIPILGCSFDFYKIALSKNIEIVEMDELFQLSRAKIHNYGSGTHETVRGASTHAFKITNYYLEYDSFDRLRGSLGQFGSYPIQIIEYLFASFRISFKVEIGYAQVFSELVNVECNFADAYLMPLTGTDNRQYPPKFDDFGWLKNPYIFTREECLEVKKIYGRLMKMIDNKWIDLSISRLNTSFLRNNKEDAFLDRLIGIESLITEDSNSEITYRMGLRIAYVMSNSIDKLNYKTIMSKLYSYRSAIVHGEKNKEKKAIFKLDEIEYDCEELSKDIYCEIMKKIIINDKYHCSELGTILDKEIIDKINN